MRIALLFAAVVLTGCAHVKFADGQRVAIEHDPALKLADFQAQADDACIKSGGKAPAVLVSDLPVHNALPAAMLMHTATFRCS